MSVPTYEDICTLVRSLLSDTEVGTGEVFTNDMLQPFFSLAFREMHDSLAAFGYPRQKKTSTATIPINTVSITCAALSTPITDMAEPLKLDDAASSAGPFQPVYNSQTPPEVATASPSLGFYCWETDTFYFAGCTTGTRFLRIRYNASAPVSPTTGSVGIDQSQNFLSYRTASLAAGAKGMDELANRYGTYALGPQLKADGAAGYLSGLISVAMKAIKRQEARRPSDARLT